MTRQDASFIHSSSNSNTSGQTGRPTTRNITVKRDWERGLWSQYE